MQTSEEQSAIDQGFKKTASTQFNIVSIGGDLTVEVSHDSVRWMKNSVIVEPHSVVSDTSYLSLSVS